MLLVLCPHNTHFKKQWDHAYISSEFWLGLVVSNDASKVQVEDATTGGPQRKLGQRNVKNLSGDRHIIWTFTFHKKSGFVKAILKSNFKPAYRLVSWTSWTENSDLSYSFSFFFAGVVRFTDFWTLLLIFYWLDDSWRIQVAIWCKTWLKRFNLFEIAVTVCKK